METVVHHPNNNLSSIWMLRSIPMNKRLPGYKNPVHIYQYRKQRYVLCFQLTNAPWIPNGSLSYLCLFPFQKAYLELNDWEVNQAFEAARQDGSEHDGNDPFTKAVHRQDSMKDMNNECTFLCKQFSSFLKNVMKK